MTATKTLKIFISYAHEDEDYSRELQKHLSQLRREGIIEDWSDSAIMAGADWDDTIKSNIQKSDIILFLVSSDFMASTYINDVEMKRAIERNEKGDCILLPVIIRTCDFSSLPISQYQALPKSAKPVSTWEDRDAAWLDVVRQIRRLAESLKLKQAKEENKNQSTHTNRNESTTEEKKSYKERVAEGQIKQVIKELMKENEGSKQEAYNTLVLLLSRHNKNEGDSNKGLITNEAAIMNRNKISHALIAVIDELFNS